MTKTLGLTGFDQNFWPYSIDCNAGVWEQQVEWLQSNMGDVAERWDYYRGKFWFKDEKDLIFYKLMW